MLLTILDLNIEEENVPNATKIHSDIIYQPGEEVICIFGEQEKVLTILRRSFKHNKDGLLTEVILHGR